MDCKFVVGQEVVCIDDSTFNPIHMMKGRMAGKVFTIAAIEANLLRGKIGLNLVGLERHPQRGRTWFCSSFFRPVVKNKTNISIFTKMLKKKELVHD